MNQAGSSTLSSQQLSASVPSSLERNVARDLRRPAGAIRSWATLMMRVITSGLLNRDLQRTSRHAGIDRADIETLALIQRAFGKRHG